MPRLLSSAHASCVHPRNEKKSVSAHDMDALFSEDTAHLAEAQGIVPHKEELFAVSSGSAATTNTASELANHNVLSGVSGADLLIYLPIIACEQTQDDGHHHQRHVSSLPRTKTMAASHAWRHWRADPRAAPFTETIANTDALWPAPRALSATQRVVSGGWKCLLLPHVLTIEAQQALAACLRPRSQHGVNDSTPTVPPVEMDALEQGGAATTAGHGQPLQAENDPDAEDYECGAAKPTARVVDAARTAATSYSSSSSRLSRRAPLAPEKEKTVHSGLVRCREGSLKRPRSDEENTDADVQEDAQEASVMQMMRDCGAVRHHLPVAAPGTRFGSTRTSAVTILQFTCQAHLLTSRLPHAASQDLTKLLLAAVHGVRSGFHRTHTARDEEAAVLVPFWISCFAHTPFIFSSVVSSLPDAMPKRQLSWPSWVPDQTCSLRILDALHAAAWVVVKDITHALQANARVNSSENTVHKGESEAVTVSSAVLSLMHFTEAVLSPSRHADVLAIFCAQLPFRAHRGDLLRYPPPASAALPDVFAGPAATQPLPTPPPAHTNNSNNTGNSKAGAEKATTALWRALRRAVECPPAFSTSSAMADPLGRAHTMATNTTSTAEAPPSCLLAGSPILFPSVLDVIHDIALHLLARYLPSWASQLQNFLALRLRESLPCGGSTTPPPATPLALAISRSATEGFLTTVRRLVVWQHFWKLAVPYSSFSPSAVPAPPRVAVSFAARTHALRLSVTISQWSLCALQRLLLPHPIAAPAASCEKGADALCESAQDENTLVVMLTALPNLCRVYMNAQERQSVLRRAVQALVTRTATTLTDVHAYRDHGFRVLAAVLISASQEDDIAHAAQTCWSEWIVPLRAALRAVRGVCSPRVCGGEQKHQSRSEDEEHAKKTETEEQDDEDAFFTSLLARVRCAGQTIRLALHRSACSPRGRHMHRQECAEDTCASLLLDDDIISAVDADASVVFTSASVASACQGSTAVSAWSAPSEISERSQNTLTRTTQNTRTHKRAADEEVVCPWLPYIHRVDVRRLRWIVSYVQTRLSSEAQRVTRATMRTPTQDRHGTSLLHVNEEGESDDEGGEETDTLSSHSMFCLDEQENDIAYAGHPEEEEEEENEYFFAMLATGTHRDVPALPTHTTARDDGGYGEAVDSQESCADNPDIVSLVASSYSSMDDDGI